VIDSLDCLDSPPKLQNHLTRVGPGMNNGMTDERFGNRSPEKIPGQQ
jgi:hypothetical protein